MKVYPVSRDPLKNIMGRACHIFKNSCKSKDLSLLHYIESNVQTFGSIGQT